MLTHLARNADSHTRRLEGALRGEDVDRYPGGTEQRDREIDEGAGRPAKALVGDVAESCRRLEDTWRECERAGWPDPHDAGSGKRPTNESPLYRRREVEIHHADLGLGYTPADWPQDYAEWELRHSLGQLPGRIPDSRDQLRFLTWLLGRSDFPADLKLTAW